MTRLQYVKRNVGAFFRRNSTVIPLAIIALSIMGVFLLQALMIGKLQDTVDRQNRLISQTTAISHELLASSKQRSSQIADVNRHLDCIVRFFAQPDYTSKAIADIETCRIDTTATSTSVAPTPVTNTPSQTATPTTSSQAQKNGVSNNGKKPTSTPSAASHQNLLQQVLRIIGL